MSIPGHLWGPIVQRWSEARFPPLAQYATYAAHVLKVELFFQIALAANLISADRASNRADIAYLFYLPFCHLFVSGDKLHRLCATPFLTKEQDFVWGPDLKADLQRINREFASAPEEIRQQGLHKLAPRPPGNDTHLVVALWTKHAPNGRADKEISMHLSEEGNRKLAEHVKAFAKAPTAPDVAQLPSDELQGVAIERLVPPKRGGWWLIPKEVADKKNDEEA